IRRRHHGAPDVPPGAVRVRRLPGRPAGAGPGPSDCAAARRPARPRWHPPTPAALPAGGPGRAAAGPNLWARLASSGHHSPAACMRHQPLRNFHARQPVATRYWEGFMRPIAMLGVVLIVLGIAGLFFSRVSWTETKPVAKVGPLELNSQEDHTVWIPTAAGVVAVLAGIALVFVGRKAA